MLDAFQKPPVFKTIDRRSGEKRRSVDSTMLLGVGEDVRADDPVFMLRRAVGFRNTGKSKMSAPLDEIALQHFHHQRESASESSPVGGGPEDAKPQPQMSRQELIAAQRLASREKQRAILSAESNSERGVDVLLPGGNAMLRSSLHETSDKMRYSYVQDGEIFDISDIVEEEQRGGRVVTGQGDKRDWLEGVVARNHEGLGDNLDRVLNRIKGSKPAGKSGAPSFSSGTADSRTSDVSASSLGEASASLSDPVSSTSATTPSGIQDAKPFRAASATPTDRERAGSKTGSYLTKPSIGSLHSEDSSNEMSSPSTPATTATNHHARSNTPRRGPLIVRDDFGLSDMMAIIELNAASKKPPPPPPMDHVDEMLFGSQLNLEELHPRVREMFAGTFQQLDDMDRVSSLSFRD